MIPLLFMFSCSPTFNLQLKEGYNSPQNPHLRFEGDDDEGLILYKGFVVKYDSVHKVPSFVIHRLSPQQLSDSAGIEAKRKNRFWVDEKRLAGISATSKDYRKSGFDRGHHAPAGDFVFSQAANDESFVYTNISPQNPKLNRGALSRIESGIREKVRDCNCTAYIITGTYFENLRTETIGEHGVGVPKYIYKLAFFPDKGRMYAFLLDNTKTEFNDDLFRYQRSVDAIELLTEEDFFDQIEEAQQNKLEEKVTTF